MRALWFVVNNAATNSSEKLAANLEGRLLLTIDADAHVIECDKTWDYLEGEDKRYRPVAIAVDMQTGKTQNFWIIGGRLIGGRDKVGKDKSKE